MHNISFILTKMSTRFSFTDETRIISCTSSLDVQNNLFSSCWPFTVAQFSLPSVNVFSLPYHLYSRECCHCPAKLWIPALLLCFTKSDFPQCTSSDPWAKCQITLGPTRPWALGYLTVIHWKGLMSQSYHTAKMLLLNEALGGPLCVFTSTLSLKSPIKSSSFFSSEISISLRGPLW